VPTVATGADLMTETSKFDGLAAVYAAIRPSYPQQAFDAVEELSGVSLSGARVADVGAGTGISSRQLRDRGARVTAVEVSFPMLQQLAAGSPGVAAVQGSGNALPLRDAGVDLVTFATAWHWVDPERAVPEVRRVLRPRGALACFWNIPVPDVGVRHGYRERMREALGHEPDLGTMTTADRKPDDGPRLELGSHSHLEVRSASIPWSRWITLEQRLANIQSRSYVAELPPDRLARFLDGEREALADRVRDDGLIEEAYTTWLGVVRF
jgi:SAM-dependent methyltransferase